MKKTHSSFNPFQNNNANDLRRLHLNLNQYYHTLLFGNAKDKLTIDQKRAEYKKLETSWINKEKQTCLKKYNCDREIKDVYRVELALREHAVSKHPLFEYLCYESTLTELKSFIQSEAILNFEFFDYLALALIGVSDQAKAEIATNLWDEAGRGEIKKFHTSLFANLMADLGLSYDRAAIISKLSCEGLAGINLFSYCSLYPYNKMMYFGLLAATELLDPPHYKQLIYGMKRLFAGRKIDQAYYIEHESLDVEHANGWLKKVILPELAIYPQKTRDFWLGFYLRLDSAKNYYDKMLQSLTQEKAA